MTRRRAVLVVLALLALALASCDPSEGLNLACGAPIFGLVAGIGLVGRRR